MCYKKKNIYKINFDIKSNFIRLIQEENNLNEIIDLSVAINNAKKLKLDIVQINFDGKYPVCKMLDFKKYIYQKNKAFKKNKKNQSIIIFKEIYIKPNINVSDLNVKINKIRLFLKNKYKVKIFIKFVGREINYPDIGIKLLDKIKMILCEEEKIAICYSSSYKIENKQIFIFLNAKN